MSPLHAGLSVVAMVVLILVIWAADRASPLGSNIRGANMDVQRGAHNAVIGVTYTADDVKDAAK